MIYISTSSQNKSDFFEIEVIKLLLVKREFVVVIMIIIIIIIAIHPFVSCSTITTTE